MAQLPPKVPSSMSPNWPGFGHQRAPSMASFLPVAAPPTAGNQPSWVDEFLDFTSARRGAHRRSMSDSVAFLEAAPMIMSSNGGGGVHEFDRLDEDQLISMFPDDVPPSSGNSAAPLSSSTPTSPSDHNSINDEKPSALSSEQQAVNEVEEAQSLCKSEPQVHPAAQPAAAAAEQQIVDPKRVKRILANRQSAQRSRVRKLQYISELERSVTSLQTEVSALSPRVAFLDHQRSVLTVGNSHLKQRIAALAQDKIFKDAHQEALKKEIERLRQVYHQQSIKKMSAAPTGDSPEHANKELFQCSLCLFFIRSSASKGRSWVDWTIFLLTALAPLQCRSVGLAEAHALGMMNKGHVWIVADDSITNLFEYYSSDLSDYAEGVLGIKDYFNKTTKSYQEFQAEFRRSYKSNYGAEVDPGISSLLAYDAVNMLSLAENKGKTLLEGILSSHFVGLTGYIRSGESGNLATKESSSAFQIINVVGKSYRELGIWYAEDGFYEGDEKVDIFGPVFWPGGPRGTPGGWGKLKIGVPARTTFDQFVEVKYDHKGKVKLITGYCIDVFMETLKRLKYNLTFEFFPFHGTYDDLIDQVTIKNYDAVVGDITILAKRSEKVDFTQPYVGSGLAMLARVKPDHKTWVFLKPFTCSVWMCTILGFLYTAAIVWFLERKENSEFHGSWSNQIEATILLIFTIFCNFKKIRSYYTLVVILVWFFVVFIITQSYTASLSSILTTQKLEPVVSFTRIGCDGDSFVVKYLEEVLGYPPRKINTIGKEKNYPEAFESGKISVAFMETPYLRVFLSRHEEYTVHGETHRLGGFGFVFPKGSPLAVDLSEAILELSEEGVLKDLENKWFSFSFSNYPSTEKIGNKNSLSLGHLWGLFVLTGATTTFIFVLFLIRLSIRNSQRQEEEDGGNVNERQLQSPSMHYSSSMEKNLDGIEDETNQHFHMEQTYQGSPKSQVLRHEGNDYEEFE
ncbi:hypothetical protein J5N97_019796 [Dioscorea zingiberensis]|uniref:BZIP domain-containing protein n=2 Tax=Magnoliopsida TaxID=3398 RepID=A0A9D5HD19_9LILI|nr:hypothetical protein J5N97_019796 [Dioscorea zingiberensis]